MQSAGELNSFNINRYPDRIVLSATAENYISALAEDLILGTVEIWQLSPALSQFHWFAYYAGCASRQAEVDGHSRDADRYYQEMCRRKGVPLWFFVHTDFFVDFDGHMKYGAHASA